MGVIESIQIAPEYSVGCFPYDIQSGNQNLYGLRVLEPYDIALRNKAIYSLSNH